MFITKESKEKVVEKLRKEGYSKLFIVSYYVTDQLNLVSTETWFVYDDKSLALVEIEKFFNTQRLVAHSFDGEFYDWSDLESESEYVKSFFVNDGFNQYVYRIKLSEA